MDDFKMIDYTDSPAVVKSASLIERISGALLQFDWIGNWKVIVGILIGLYLLKILLYRERVLSETREILLTLPCLIASAIYSLIALGVFNLLKTF